MFELVQKKLVLWDSAVSYCSLIVTKLPYFTFFTFINYFGSTAFKVLGVTSNKVQFDSFQTAKVQTQL